AMVIFAFVAPVHWEAAGALALGSLVGGMVGARLARRVPARPLRVGIALVGLAVAAWLAVAGA
ncbi:MAG TPA: TSUP family transporter, partial [Solirubrobacteraceae bacterium]|nr:TSUP family transporter [Solirubrobacteraceae bacterium]